MIGIDYADGDDYKYKIEALKRDTNEIEYIMANKIILNIPPMDLVNNLPYMVPLNDEDVLDVFDSVSYVPCNKMNFIYDTSRNSEFWEENLENLQLASRSNTDEEIGEILIERSWMNGTLFHVHFYALGAKSDIFNKLQIMGDEYPIDDDLIVDESLISCSTYVVNEALGQLETIANLSDIPLPLACFNNPMGGNMSNVAGLPSWKYGKNIFDVYNKLMKPKDDEDIYVAVSDYTFGKGGTSASGWQWGAFQASIDLMVKYFGFDGVNPFYDDFYPQCDPDVYNN